MSGTASHQLAEQINNEYNEANSVLIRTKAMAAKMAKHLTFPGNLQRYVHDEEVLVSLKQQLQDFNIQTKRWKVR